MRTATLCTSTIAPTCLVALLGACAGAPAEEGCGVTNETLGGTVWIMDEPWPDRNQSFPNAQARMKIAQGEEGLSVKYSVGNPIEMHDYSCTPRNNDDGSVKVWNCAEPFRSDAWCATLEANREGSCTLDMLKELGATGSDEEIKAGMKKGKEEVAKMKASEDPQVWPKYKAQMARYDNKLRGLLYLRVGSRCDLKVTDMYQFLQQGKIVEDSNPVGSIGFLKVDDPPYFWENTDSGRTYIDLAENAPPADIAKIPLKRDREYEMGAEVHYFYIGQDAAKAKEGCTYSMDVWTQWTLEKKDVPVEPDADGRLWWYYAHAWNGSYNEMYQSRYMHPAMQQEAPWGILQVVRYETCEGKQKKLDVLSNNTNLLPMEKPAAPADAEG